MGRISIFVNAVGLSRRPEWTMNETKYSQRGWAQRTTRSAAVTPVGIRSHAIHVAVHCVVLDQIRTWLTIVCSVNLDDAFSIAFDRASWRIFRGVRWITLIAPIRPLRYFAVHRASCGVVAILSRKKC